MNANLMTKKIEMTKTEATAAGKLNSEKFNELKALREMYPGYEITIVKSATKKIDHFKGLDYDYMKKYIDGHNANLLEDFYQLRGMDTDGKPIEMAAVATYGEIKMWFLTQFPEIENMSKNVNAIIERARKIRAEKAAV